MSEEEKKTFPKIIAVDENDTEIGTYDLYDALAKGYLRRVSSVYIFNEDGDLLLQKRPDWVLAPNCWSQSAAGHINEGKSYKETAVEELQEELGLTVPLVEVGLSLPSPGLFNGIYKGIVTNDEQINFDKDEVAAVRWVPVTELEKELKDVPESFTQSFLDIWERYRDKILAA
jgi:isopentenyl-diphosphate delta-isomerase